MSGGAESGADPGVEDAVARVGGISYLHIPSADPARSAAFYQAVFGWSTGGRPEQPSFRDGTGHVIGHWVADRDTAGDAGVLPYVYVTDVDETLATAVAQGGAVIKPPFAEGALRVATFRDPHGNVVGVWQS